MEKITSARVAFFLRSSKKGGDLDKKLTFTESIQYNYVRSDILNEISGGDLHEKIDFHRIQSRAP